jgi:hypothetical protein
MPNIKQAAEDLNAITNKFKGLVRVQTALDELGDLEVATTEYKNLKEKAVADYQEAQKQLQNIHHRIQEAGKKADAAAGKADETIAAAIKRADAIIVEANEAAAAIKKEGEKARDLVNKQISELKIISAGIDTEIQAKKNELKAVLDAIKESKSKVASL